MKLHFFFSDPSLTFNKSLKNQYARDVFIIYQTKLLNTSNPFPICPRQNILWINQYLKTIIQIKNSWTNIFYHNLYVKLSLFFQYFLKNTLLCIHINFLEDVHLVTLFQQHLFWKCNTWYMFWWTKVLDIIIY